MKSDITICIPTSPIPSHPSTAIIDRVIESIRFHLPESPLIIMADGVRPAVEHRREQYAHYLKNLEEKYPGHVVRFDEPTQQARMLRVCLDRHVTTRDILFNEHDTYLVTSENLRDNRATDDLPEASDLIINWEDITGLLHSGGANIVRFYLWEKIWHEHQYLMRGQMVHGESRFIQTVQYSGWPHVASADFYRKILRQYFRPDENQMLEIGLYGPVCESPWEDFRTTIYYPGNNNRRFYHLNGRADADGNRDAAEW